MARCEACSRISSWCWRRWRGCRLDTTATSWTSSTMRSNSATSFRGCARRSLTFLRIRRGAMKRITLAFVSVAAAALAAGAQEPPTPPTRPTPAPVPAPAPRVRVTPVTPIAPMAPLDLDFRYDMDLDMTRMRAELDRMRPPVIDQEQLREMTRDASRVALEASRIDVAETTRQAMEAARDAMRDIEWTTPVPPTPWIAPVPAVAPVAPMIYGTPFAGYQNDFTNRPAPAPWAQGDPADSVYNVAREALNSGDYGRAARLFNDISQKYSKS